MVKALVSIITPCYNGEKTIVRFMDSVLNQTYNKIELILVNDGSTDNTETIVKSYESKFLEKGMIFKYIYQENKGVGGAIDTGLKHFTGDYLCWPDSDDYLEPDSVKERLTFLEEHPEYAIVTSDAYVRNYNNLENYKALISNQRKNLDKQNQFEYLLNDDGIICNGCHMVRTKDFLKVNPLRTIYPSRGGQNWQMLLPIYYSCNAYFLNKPLYNYIDYPNSLSKNKNTLEFYLFRFNEYREILIHTLEMIEEIQDVKLGDYKVSIEKKYAFLKMHFSLKYFDYKNFDKEFSVKKKYGIEKRDILLLIRRYLKFINSLYLKMR